MKRKRDKDKAIFSLPPMYAADAEGQAHIDRMFEIRLPPQPESSPLVKAFIRDLLSRMYVGNEPFVEWMKRQKS
jgi:hypothetical protein